MAKEKRLIDANALLEKMQFRLPINDKTSEVIAECVDIAVRYIKNAPTVDAVEVAHAQWEPYAIQPNGFVGSYRCTACGNTSINDSNYCPNCGAKMDGGNEDEKPLR